MPVIDAKATLQASNDDQYSIQVMELQRKIDEQNMMLNEHKGCTNWV